MAHVGHGTQISVLIHFSAFASQLATTRTTSLPIRFSRFLHATPLASEDSIPGVLQLPSLSGRIVGCEPAVRCRTLHSVIGHGGSAGFPLGTIMGTRFTHTAEEMTAKLNLRSSLRKSWWWHEGDPEMPQIHQCCARCRRAGRSWNLIDLSAPRGPRRESRRKPLHFRAALQ